MTRTARCSLGQLAVAAIYALTLNACIVGAKCDSNQHHVSDALEVCECNEGYVVSSTGYGCEKCGNDEEVVSGKCTCKNGFSRVEDGKPCQSNSSTPGRECTSASDCSDAFPYCAASEAAPYCTTTTCARNDDCPENWRCAAVGEATYCRKPPTGLSQTCQTSADCVDAEVAFCESFMSHTCIINDCSHNPGKCLSGSVCCDLTSLIGQSLCISTTYLVDDGKCYGGTDPVRP